MGKITLIACTIAFTMTAWVAAANAKPANGKENEVANKKDWTIIILRPDQNGNGGSYAERCCFTREEAQRQANKHNSDPNSEGAAHPVRKRK